MKRSHIIAAVTAGLMLTSTAVEIINSTLQVHTVYAISAAARKVGDKLDLINKTIKSNGLDLKNITLIKTMLSEVKSLNSKLSDGATKKGYTERIAKLEWLILVGEEVNSLERSYNNNSKTISNALVWEGMIRNINPNLAKIDRKIYLSEYNSLVNRIGKINQVIKDIKGRFEASFNRAEALLKEGIALSSKDKNGAIECFKKAKAIAVSLPKHESKLPLIKRINDGIKPLDPSLIKIVTVNSEEDGAKLKGYYDIVQVGEKPIIKMGELSNVEIAELNLITGSVRLVNSSVGSFNGGDLKDIMNVFLEKTTINNLYVNGDLVLYDSDNLDPMDARGNINIKNVVINTRNSQPNVGGPFVSLQCGVGNLYVNTGITLMTGGVIKNLSVNASDVYCEQVGNIENLNVEKGAKNLVIRGQGSIAKANIKEPGVVVYGVKIPEKTPNIEINESKAIVKRVMKFIVNMELNIEYSDPILGYKDYISQVAIDNISTSVTPISGKDNIYRVTITNGKYSESREVKITILKPTMTLEKKGELNNGECNFKLSSKNGIGANYIYENTSIIDYASDGGYIALQVIDSKGQAIKSSDIFEGITFKRDEEFIDIIPDNNREKGDFGISGYEGQETKLPQPELGNSIFYGVRSFKDKIYSIALRPGEDIDIVMMVKGKVGAALGEYTIKMTPAIQGKDNKFTQISDPIEYKYIVK